MRISRWIVSGIAALGLYIGVSARVGAAVSDTNLEDYFGLVHGTLDGMVNTCTTPDAVEGSGVSITFSGAADSYAVIGWRFMTNEHLWDLQPCTYNDFAFSVSYAPGASAQYIADTYDAFLYPSGRSDYAALDARGRLHGREPARKWNSDGGVWRG